MHDSCCRVPGANQQRVPRRVGLVKQADWCQQAFLEEQLQVLYVPIQGSVYGFRIDDGERIYNWEDLHKQLVTAIVHPAGSNHIITGSHDMTAKVMHAHLYMLFTACSYMQYTSEWVFSESHCSFANFWVGYLGRGIAVLTSMALALSAHTRRVQLSVYDVTASWLSALG